MGTYCMLLPVQATYSCAVGAVFFYIAGKDGKAFQPLEKGE